MKILSKLDNTGMIDEVADKRYVTDAEKLTWNNKSDTDTVTTINGKTGAISKADIVALGIPSQDTNTTYSEITTAEIDTGTASTLRTITGRRVKYILDKVQGWISGLTKSDVALGNVDNTSDLDKPVSTATQTALDGKVNNSQVLTNVPVGAKFTDTVYTHPASHPASMITDLPTGKKVARFVVGTSTAGWTAADCDYLCDGTADQVEINNAITALPATGGEVVILDGTYSVTAKIDVTKDNVSIRGNGNATTLKRMYDSSTREGVITLTSRSGCKISNLQVDGNRVIYTNDDNIGIYLNDSSNNSVTGNTCNNNNDAGIYLDDSSNNSVTSNTCNNNKYNGIYVKSSSNNTVTGNNAFNNNETGIYLDNASNNTVTGNNSNNNASCGIYLFGSSNNNAVTGNTCNNNASSGIFLFGFSNNKVTSNTVTGNSAFNNNDIGIYLYNASNNNITNNTTIRGTGLPTDYAANQQTIVLNGPGNSYNLISNNNCMGKALVIDDGTGNTAYGNKWDEGHDILSANIDYTDTNSNLGDATDVQTALDNVGAQLSAIEDVALSRQTKYWNRPAAYKIKVAAGRFNMLWDNQISTMWAFPAGTVLYSDGTTPIRTSTDVKPDVIIPAGGGYVWLVSAMWNGPYTLRSYDTSAILKSALADLPSLTDTLNLAGCTLVTGALSDLPPLTNYLSLSGCSQVTGDLADLPPLTSRLDLGDCSNVTGALSDLPPLTFYLSLSNCPNVTGALSDLLPLTNTLNLSNCSQVTGAYTAVNGSNVPKTTILTGTGVSSTDMDATLIAYAACTRDNGTFTATGKTRTAASDAAVTTLTGRGWAISGITKV